MFCEFERGFGFASLRRAAAPKFAENFLRAFSRAFAGVVRLAKIAHRFKRSRELVESERARTDFFQTGNFTQKRAFGEPSQKNEFRADFSDLAFRRVEIQRGNGFDAKRVERLRRCIAAGNFIERGADEIFRLRERFREKFRGNASVGENARQRRKLRQRGGFFFVECDVRFVEREHFREGVASVCEIFCGIGKARRFLGEFAFVVRRPFGGSEREKCFASACARSRENFGEQFRRFSKCV